MTDWVTWPIFILQALIFIIMLLPRRLRLLKLRAEFWVGMLLITAAVAIVFSLYHDSTQLLNLHF